MNQPETSSPRRDALALLTLALVLTVVLAPMLTAPSDTAPGLAGEDGATQWLHWRVFGARWLRQGGAPVYMYWFTWETDQPWLMSAHTLEIPFVFDTVQASPITGSSPRRQELADQLCDVWVAFARTGRPVHAGLPYWPAYQLPERGTMVLDLPLRLVADPRGDERRAWHGPVPMPWEPGASVGAV